MSKKAELIQKGVISGKLNNVIIYPNLEDIKVTPTTKEQILISEKDGYKRITVPAVDSSIDPNIKPENIKKDITILGITGTVREDDIDWHMIGYNDRPTAIREAYEHALDIKNNYVEGSTTMPSVKDDCRLVFFPFINISNVSRMYAAFNGCTALISIPLLDTSNVTDMSYMFASCHALANIPPLNTSKVTNMDHMFNQCSKLTKIPLLDTSNVTNMCGMFNTCRTLTNIPLLNTSNVTDMSYMFNQCSELTEIPSLDTSNITSTRNMFNQCSKLTKIPLLDTSNVTMMYNMFNSCYALANIPLLNTSKVTNMGDMFYGIRNLSDNDLNTILRMCINAKSYTNTKTLNAIGISKTYYRNRGIENLPNYQAFLDAGWTKGY